MGNERLLSEQEISKALTVSAEFVSENAWSFGPLTVAQDRKTTAARDKWWVTEIDKHLKQFQGYEYIDNEWWQSLKQSLEVMG